MSSAGSVGGQDNFASSRSLNRMTGIGMQRRVLNGGMVGGPGLGMGNNTQFGAISGYGEMSNTQMTSGTSLGNHMGGYNASSVEAGQTVANDGALNQPGVAVDSGLQSNNTEMSSDVNQGLQHGIVSSVDQTGQMNESTLPNEGKSSSFIENKEISEDYQEVSSMNNE
jgi:hypothetical protein